MANHWLAPSIWDNFFGLDASPYAALRLIASRCHVPLTIDMWRLGTPDVIVKHRDQIDEFLKVMDKDGVSCDDLIAQSRRLRTNQLHVPRQKQKQMSEELQNIEAKALDCRVRALTTRKPNNYYEVELFDHHHFEQRATSSTAHSISACDTETGG